MSREFGKDNCLQQIILKEAIKEFWNTFQRKTPQIEKDFEYEEKEAWYAVNYSNNSIQISYKNTLSVWRKIITILNQLCQNSGQNLQKNT